MIVTGLVLLLTGVVVTLVGCLLCGEWADRHSLRPFIWLLSIGMVLVAIGYGTLTVGAVR